MLDTKEKTDGPVLSMDRVFNAPRAAVWAAWTDAEKLAVWMGPEGYTCSDPTADARVGGTYSVTLTGSTGVSNTCLGEYLEVLEPERLVFTFSWRQEDGQPGQRMLITIDLEDLGGRTRMRFFQQNFIDEDARDNHNQGWTGSFAKLAAFVEADGGKA